MEDKAVFYEYYSVTSLEKGSKYRHDVITTEMRMTRVNVNRRDR